MNERADWARGRGNLYRFRAAAFLQPPNEAVVATVSDNRFLDQMAGVFGSKAVDDLRAFAREFHDNHEDLDQEFQDLFMVPLGRYVPPYEAVYRDQRQIGDTMVCGLLVGPSTLAVKQLYREAGATISEDIKELPDHVGLELACMEFLCEQEARAWEQDDAERAKRTRALQQRLLQEHLLRWVPALCVRIRENAAGPFYRGIAGLTEASLKREAETFA